MSNQQRNRQNQRNRNNQQKQHQGKHNTNKPLQPINLEELRELAQGEVIQIPSFVSGEKMAVRVKKIDLTAELTRDGVIPNKLQTEVVHQFEQGKSEHQVAKQIEEGITGMSDVGEFLPMIDNLVSKALVEPTWDDFEEVYPLTLEQKMAIFNWTMQDVDSFRPSSQQSRPNPNANSKRKNVGRQTK